MTGHMSRKFIFVTGGVLSGVGKGVSVASIGRLLKSRSLKVSVMKLDPYINVDPGTMSPLQHGEVFVTVDGAETDLDLGHYERFIDENLRAVSNLTTGGVYDRVISRERRGDFLGGTIQVIPHITDEIKARIHDVGKTHDADVVIVEVGGTVGDIENIPFVEALRQMRREVGSEERALRACDPCTPHWCDRRTKDQTHAAQRYAATWPRHPSRRGHLSVRRAVAP